MKRSERGRAWAEGALGGGSINWFRISFALGKI